ncbi:hypothetical protein GCM10028778_21890 [Barrientosiimonas marina]
MSYLFININLGFGEETKKRNISLFKIYVILPLIAKKGRDEHERTIAGIDRTNPENTRAQ